ncbi:metal-dependent hydrolase [Haladaptatus sp. DJG-WS-42]|uniref:metal-dependent hydrolase n=1 Tax=Haladaptatus sp. DJG-WS-42 TaxID=3120516 RepID=UPI0030CF25DE
MWPWGHVAVGYLLYSLYHRSRVAAISGVGVFFVALGTQFPDLIDKPLGWNLGILPSGRSLAHSLITAVVIIAIAVAVARRFSREEVGWAFGLGYLSHLATDGLYPVLEGKVIFLSYLGWPLLPIPPYEHESVSILAHFLSMEWSAYFALELVLTALALALWLVDGRPGFGLLTQHLGADAQASDE